MTSIIRTTLRNFRRNKVTMFINLLGLSLGLATCLVGGLYIKHELSANQFHQDLNSIYRITVKLKEYSMNGTPYLFTETMEKDIPGVRSSLRMANQETLVRINNENFRQDIVFADSNVFSFFTLPLQQGNTTKALNGLKKVVISDAVRARFFNNVNPLGQTLQIQLDDTFMDFEVTGVVKPTPAYSSIQFDFIIPLDNRYLTSEKSKNEWGSFFLTSFLKIDANKLESVKQAMPEFVLKYVSQQKDADGKPEMNFVFNPFAQHHLSEGYSGSGLKEGRSAKALFVFGGIALIILLLACFNFMNLTNAQSSRRTIEVGIRKVVGAGKTQLIRQFLGEAIVLSVFASMLALGIAELSLLIFLDILEVSISVIDRRNTDIYVGLLIVTVFAGILAGSYPALVLSNLSTLDTFKRYFRIGGSNWITRSILSLQFGLSIVLIVCAIVMWKQHDFIMNKDLGYNKDQIFVLPFSTRDTSSIGFLKNEIKKMEGVVNVAQSSGAFTRGNNVSIQKMPDNSRIMIYMLNVDEDYIPTMEMKIVEGHAFREDEFQSGNTVMVNEALIKKLNLKDSIGMQLGRTIGWIRNPTIAGVVKDFHHAEMRSEIQPLMLTGNTSLNESYLMIRLAPTKILAAKESIQALWEKTNENSPFEYFFLDDDIGKQYASEQRWSKIISLATGMAIFLSMLGLLGLAMFTAEQRKKEIGIRKVLGASIQQLITLLSKDYLWLIVIAFVLSVPVSYYVMTHYWLDNFAYKITMDIFIYMTALVVVIVIAGLAVGSQTIRAAMQNPADTLKEE